MDSQACETPLVELLERVPEDARAWYEHDPANHSHIPYGLHCRRAAAEIRSLTRRLRECADEIERLRNESQSLRERVERDLIEMRIGNATPCEPCHGLGVRAYGSTATWRGGVGGQAITSDVCDRCWGSGNADRPWPSHRHLLRERQ